MKYSIKRFFPFLVPVFCIFISYLLSLLFRDNMVAYRMAYFGSIVLTSLVIPIVIVKYLQKMLSNKVLMVLLFALVFLLSMFICFFGYALFYYGVFAG